MAKTFTVDSSHLHPSMPWSARDQLWIKKFEESHGITVTPANILLVRQLISTEKALAEWSKKRSIADEHIDKYTDVAANLREALQRPTLEEKVEELAFYVTTYCNFAHRLKDGMPIDHECRVIPPEALEAEMNDDYERAQEILRNTPEKISRGVRR